MIKLETIELKNIQDKVQTWLKIYKDDKLVTVIKIGQGNYDLIKDALNENNKTKKP